MTRLQLKAEPVVGDLDSGLAQRLEDLQNEAKEKESLLKGSSSEQITKFEKILEDKNQTIDDLNARLLELEASQALISDKASRLEQKLEGKPLSFRANAGNQR